MFSGAIISPTPLSQQGATRPGNRWALLPSGIASVLCFNCQLTILTQFPPGWFFIYVQCCPWRKPDFDATVNDRWIKGGSIPRSPRANLRIHPSQDYWPTRCFDHLKLYITSIHSNKSPTKFWFRSFDDLKSWLLWFLRTHLSHLLLMPPTVCCKYANEENLHQIVKRLAHAGEDYCIFSKPALSSLSSVSFSEFS